MELDVVYDHFAFLLWRQGSVGIKILNMHELSKWNNLGSDGL